MIYSKTILAKTYSKKSEFNKIRINLLIVLKVTTTEGVITWKVVQKFSAADKNYV